MSDKQGWSFEFDVGALMFGLFMIVCVLGIAVGVVAKMYFDHQENVARIQAGQEVKP